MMRNIRPFAVHNGGTLFVFIAPDLTSFDKWITAFKNLEVNNSHAHREMWVDKVRQKENSLRLFT